MSDEASTRIHGLREAWARGRPTLIWLTAILITVEIGSLAAFRFAGLSRPEVLPRAGLFNDYVVHPHAGWSLSRLPLWSTSLKRSGSKPFSSVVILGGSVAGGLGASSPDQAWFAGLADLLGLPTENFANPGYISRQEVEIYRALTWSRDPAPRLVIDLTGANDLFFYLFRGLPVGDPPYGRELALILRSGYPPPKDLSEYWLNLLKRTAGYAMIHLAWNSWLGDRGKPILVSSWIDELPPSIPREVPLPLVEATAAHFLDQMTTLALLAKAHGSKFVAVLQPILFWGGEIAGGTNPFFPTREAAEGWASEIGHRKSAFTAYYDRVLDGLEERRQEGLLEYVDLRAAMKDVGPAFLDIAHLNDRGNAALATAVYEGLKARKLF